MATDCVKSNIFIAVSFDNNSIDQIIYCCHSHIFIQYGAINVTERHYDGNTQGDF